MKALTFFKSVVNLVMTLNVKTSPKKAYSKFFSHKEKILTTNKIYGAMNKKS